MVTAVCMGSTWAGDHQWLGTVEDEVGMAWSARVRHGSIGLNWG